VLLAFKGDKSRIEEDSDVAELRITEAVLREVPKLERFQAFLRLLNSLSRGVVQILDEQSAGMLAESIEKQRRA
jgi:hypothetical protein